MNEKLRRFEYALREFKHLFKRQSKACCGRARAQVGAALSGFLGYAISANAFLHLFGLATRPLAYWVFLARCSKNNVQFDAKVADRRQTGDDWAGSLKSAGAERERLRATEIIIRPA
jgi:hypothetical protein